MSIWEGVVERLQDVGFATWVSLAGCVHHIKDKTKHAAWSIAFYLSLSGLGVYKIATRSTARANIFISPCELLRYAMDCCANTIMHLGYLF